MKGRIIVSVTNDLANDQRVHKMCTSLEAEGWSVCLLGRRLTTSLPLERSYDIKRLKLWFNKGAFFYAEMNIRILFFLLRSKFNVLHSNDLDTLLPNYIASRLKSTPLIYDTHEYFLGVPEIQHKPLVKWVWKRIESAIFPRLKYVFTVNQSIAKLYEKDYGSKPLVIRNIPFQGSTVSNAEERAQFGWTNSDFILINQGTGINIDRGMEEFVLAMAQLPKEIKLLLVGKGDILAELKQGVLNANLSKRVQFVEPIPYHQMLRFTAMADVGLSLDKDTNINYRYSLPNKLFDYIRVGIPILASNLVEVAQVVLEKKVGRLIESHSPEDISKAVLKMREEGKEKYKETLFMASKDLCWEKEVIPMISVYEHLDSLK